MGQGDRQPVADVVALDEARQRRQVDLDKDLATAGGMLRAAREAMGLSRGDVARRTNLKETHVAALEDMDIAALPAQPYTMGFVRAYAREVSLPEDALMDRFRQQAGYEKRDLAPGIQPVKRSSEMDGGRELSVLALIAVLAMVLWASWQLLVKTAPEDAEDAGRFSFSAEDQEVRIEVPADEETLGEQLVVPEAPSDNAAELAPVADVTASDEPTEANGLADETEPAAQSEAVGVAGAAAAAADTAEAQASEVEATEPAPAPVRRTVALSQIASAEPTYPPLCRGSAEDLETVTVSYSVDASGRPVAPRITSSTNPCFNGAALAALSRWRYDPASVTPQNSSGLATRFAFDKPY